MNWFHRLCCWLGIHDPVEDLEGIHCACCGAVYLGEGEWKRK